MEAATIPCWIETHNPCLKHQTNRPVERPKKRWEDEINDFLKPEEIEEGKQWKPNTQCSSNPPQTRGWASYATNARNLTFVMGVSEFSWTLEAGFFFLLGKGAPPRIS